MSPFNFREKMFYTFQNFFCPFENFLKLCNCKFLLSNLLSTNSFKVQKSFSKSEKSWKKWKTLNEARFARNVVVRLFWDNFKHCVCTQCNAVKKPYGCWHKSFVKRWDPKVGVGKQTFIHQGVTAIVKALPDNHLVVPKCSLT